MDRTSTNYFFQGVGLYYRIVCGPLAMLPGNQKGGRCEEVLTINHFSFKRGKFSVLVGTFSIFIGARPS